MPPPETEDPRKVTWNGEQLWAVTDRKAYRDAAGEWRVRPPHPSAPRPAATQDN